MKYLKVAIAGTAFVFGAAFCVWPAWSASTHFPVFQAWLVFGTTIALLLIALIVKSPFLAPIFWIGLGLGYVLTAGQESAGLVDWTIQWVVAACGALVSRRSFEALSWAYHDSNVAPS